MLQNIQYISIKINSKARCISFGGGAYIPHIKAIEFEHAAP